MFSLELFIEILNLFGDNSHENVWATLTLTEAALT